MTRARVVVLASGAGSTLGALLQAATDPAYGVQVVAVGVDRDGSGAELRAGAAGIGVWCERVDHHPTRGAFDDAVAARLAADAPDLVVLAGYMKLLGPAVVQHFRIVNTHPALLPAFPGAHAVRDALAAGAIETGATVHWVDEGVDTGPVIAQVRVPVRPRDIEQTLRSRIQAAERPLLVDVVGRLARQEVSPA